MADVRVKGIAIFNIFFAKLLENLHFCFVLFGKMLDFLKYKYTNPKNEPNVIPNIANPEMISYPYPKNFAKYARNNPNINFDAPDMSSEIAMGKNLIRPLR